VGLAARASFTLAPNALGFQPLAETLGDLRRDAAHGLARLLHLLGGPTPQRLAHRRELRPQVVAEGRVGDGVHLAARVHPVRQQFQARRREGEAGRGVRRRRRARVARGNRIASTVVDALQVHTQLRHHVPLLGRDAACGGGELPLQRGEPVEQLGGAALAQEPRPHLLLVVADDARDQHAREDQEECKPAAPAHVHCHVGEHRRHSLPSHPHAASVPTRPADAGNTQTQATALVRLQGERTGEVLAVGPQHAYLAEVDLYRGVGHRVARE
jgi:hypothetical protein